MFKSATFAALTLLATLTAAQAAVKGAVPDFSPSEAMHQTAALPKPKTPPRNPFGPTKAGADVETERQQLACQTGNIRNKCKPDIKRPSGTRA